MAHFMVFTLIVPILIPSVLSYNILLFPVFTETRRELFESVGTHLTIGDHDVHYLMYQEDCPQPEKRPSQTLIIPNNTAQSQSRRLNAANELAEWETHLLNKIVQEAHFPAAYLKALAERCATRLLADETLLSILRRLQFDLILTDLAGNDLCGLMLGKLMGGVPVGGIMPQHLTDAFAYYTGTTSFVPSYIPAEGLNEMGDGMIGRARNLLMYMKQLYFWDTSYFAIAAQEICEHLRSVSAVETCPTIQNQYRDLALVFVANDNSMELTPRMRMANAIFMAGIHCKSSTYLAKDMDNIARAYRSGVILLTLATSNGSVQYPEWLIQAFCEGLRPLPHVTFWKTDMERPEGLPENVKINKAFQVQDILGHARTRVVISFCDATTVYSAIFHAVPLICIPITEEQTNMAYRVEAKGIGLQLPLHSLTPAKLTDTIKNIVSNKSFQANVRLQSELLRDQSETSGDRLLFWVGYIIRHKGAPNLRNPATGMGLWEYLLLDILCTLLMSLLTIIFALWGIYKACLQGAHSAKYSREKTE